MTRRSFSGKPTRFEIMATEIERKFLVIPGAWSPGDRGCPIQQGYLCLDPERTVRVRIAGERAFMTVKGRTTGISRTEIEFPLAMEDAENLMDLCHRPRIEKTRHELVHGGMTWEIDVFHGENDGLIVAEVELPSEDHPFESPAWLGVEVSEDHRYSNAALSKQPFLTW